MVGAGAAANGAAFPGQPTELDPRFQPITLSSSLDCALCQTAGGKRQDERSVPAKSDIEQQSQVFDDKPGKAQSPSSCGEKEGTGRSPVRAAGSKSWLTPAQDEREAQRKLEAKRELERRKAALQEEERRKEQQRKELETQRQQEQAAQAEDSKKAAQRAAIERRRLENARKQEQQRGLQTQTQTQTRARAGNDVVSTVAAAKWVHVR